MLRTCAARLLTAPRGARQLSVTAPTLIRVKKPEGAAPGSPTPPPPPPEAAEPAPAEPPLPAAGATTAGLAGAQAAAYEAREAREEAQAIPAKPDLSKLPSLDIDPEARAHEAIEEPKPEAEGKEGGAGQRKGGRPRKEYVSSHERQRRFVTRLGFGALLVGGAGALYYFGQNGEGEKGNFWDNFKRSATEVSDVLTKPAFKKLLPDPLPPAYQHPYTLLVDLDGLLVRSQWDRQHGWRTAKRPGVDYFLGYLSQFYEIVLFTSQPLYVAEPVVDKLDPLIIYFPYRLFRESMHYVDGKLVKDLSYLNRDLSKTVVLDTNAEFLSRQPDNAIIVKPWDGKAGDHGLVDLIPFLESIPIFAPADVRPVLKNYADKDIPVEYAKQEAAMKERAIAEWQRANPSGSSGAGAGFLSGLFGGGASQPRQSEPKTYLEIKRAQAQQAYKQQHDYIQENAEAFAKWVERHRTQPELTTPPGRLRTRGSAPWPRDRRLSCSSSQAAPPLLPTTPASRQRPPATRPPPRSRLYTTFFKTHQSAFPLRRIRSTCRQLCSEGDGLGGVREIGPESAGQWDGGIAEGLAVRGVQTRTMQQ
ncbi:hypothetical protein VHUM_01547 [Vanrija humicola]|uniref:Mitochondrial import inner membrane translocase subunit TIM50 n=1 Tax=Vanrija humicola TaxID=5417 RepID=A0A7D8V3H4_VANHU|nr:hypothetical protein VHUM_01547 [Vanrija humicola]